MTGGAIARSWYDDGHPAGYTDDLGIIADRNQWIAAEPPGWHFLLAPYDETNVPPLNVLAWCRDNLSGKWIYNGSHSFHIRDESDATLFSLRWG